MNENLLEHKTCYPAGHPTYPEGRIIEHIIDAEEVETITHYDLDGNVIDEQEQS
ncbi:hypothetical protein [Pseudemcibacter aquimaris]|uniref:hypothetical protein n=1 Tax=Pseudemcibacter aquimaris TaxID=2857064 RepID=UPI0020113D0C|nr:hypothetical protein [Pseudemcibacter aquimaris]MCC3859775.1 hypothetical protein [Pseudemcibacter aquimaris]WDU60169.1 hypothetical protein KW060_07850 [Pseudemcibacter aquimaris]